MVVKSKFFLSFLSFFLSFFKFFLSFFQNLLIGINEDHYFTKKNLNDKEISKKTYFFTFFRERERDKKLKIKN